jgi:lipid A 4'-phosphatase
MNRTGLAIALAIGAVVGAVFGVAPQLDLAVSALFYDPAAHGFAIWPWHWMDQVRDAASLLIALLVAPAFFAVLGKLLAPRRPMLIPGRAALFLIATLTLGPGIMTNGVFKEYSARMRPFDVTEFGGTHQFTPWWDPTGSCDTNCSFIAGEPSGAFWTLAPAALAPPQWRALAYAAALLFGATMSVARIAAGAHFFTDVVFAGVLTFLVIWTLYGLIYRWRTRLSDAAIERPLAQAGLALRQGFSVLAGLLWRRRGKTPSP